MTNDPLDSALQHSGIDPKHSGIDPTPGYESNLESVLSRAYDGERISTAAPVVADRGGTTRRNGWIAAAAAIFVAAGVAGVIALRSDQDGTSIVDAPEPTTPATDPITVAPTTEATATTASPVTTTAAPVTTTASPATTLPSPPVATIDFTAELTRLEPTPIASFPTAPPGDLHPPAYATPAGADRIAVLDDVTGVVRFIDAETGAVLSSHPTDVPTIGSPSFLAGYFFVGPGDVLYLNVIDPDQGLAVAAYGLVGGSYVEVARVGHGVGDSELILGRLGIVVFGGSGPLLMPFVGSDGQPNGANLDVDEITFPDCDARGADTYTHTYGRTDRTWTVMFEYAPGSGRAEPDLCYPHEAKLGPNGTVVLINRWPTPDGDLQLKLTVLGDQITTYDTEWTYVGVLGTKMVFSRQDQDSIDIGIFEL